MKLGQPSLIRAAVILGLLGLTMPVNSAADTADVRAWKLMNAAWGPEETEVLQKYLEIRTELKPVFETHREGLTNHALREASVRPTIGAGVIGLLEMKNALEKLLREKGLTIDDYLRLTCLVYGRWLRAVRSDDPPERRVVRMLQELEFALSRRLRQNPPESPAERSKLEDRLDAVRYQLKFVAPFGLIDRAAVLARIDAGTKAWLESKRAQLEAADFGVFDTAAPERVKPTPEP
jgi:hypothetical protein